MCWFFVNSNFEIHFPKLEKYNMERFFPIYIWESPPKSEFCLLLPPEHEFFSTFSFGNNSEIWISQIFRMNFWLHFGNVPRTQENSDFGDFPISHWKFIPKIEIAHIILDFPLFSSSDWEVSIFGGFGLSKNSLQLSMFINSLHSLEC